MYSNRLKRIFYDYQKGDAKFEKADLEDLTPDQIIELDKKLKDENYHLDLGDPP